MNARRRRRLLVAGALVVLVGAAKPTPAEAAAPARQDGSAPESGIHSDPLVVYGLIWAATESTGLARREVTDRLRAGQSIALFAADAGSSADAVLGHFDALVDRLMARAVDIDHLPQTVADACAAWFKRSALADRPAGPHAALSRPTRLHVILISAVVETSEIPRIAVREQLRTCATLAAIVAPAGKSGAGVAATTMRHIGCKPADAGTA